jgi:hypothetical protein
MSRAATRNIDGPKEVKTRVSNGASQSPTTLYSAVPGMCNSCPDLSVASIPNNRCISNLINIGFSMDRGNQMVNLSINALKRIEIDRTTLAPKEKGHVNLFDTSDGEDNETHSGLLNELVKDVSDIGLDDSELDTKICDLMVIGRKSKSNTKKQKPIRKGTLKKNKVFP